MDTLLGSIKIGIELNDNESRETVTITKQNTSSIKLPLFKPHDTCSGKVHLGVSSKKSHKGVKIEFIGKIESIMNRGNDHVFTSREQILLEPGTIDKPVSIDFKFENLELPFESYNGINVRLRYYLLVTVGQSLLNQTKEKELLVHVSQEIVEPNPVLKMEVGVENAMHIEFEYSKSKYYLEDVVIGKIYFLLVRLKIKNMEISLNKVETSGTGANVFTEKEIVTKYEIMDGCPARGESIPIRLFLKGADIIPTMRDIDKKFSLRWYINLVLLDEDDRKYFKQQEVVFQRRPFELTPS